MDNIARLLIAERVHGAIRILPWRSFLRELWDGGGNTLTMLRSDVEQDKSEKVKNEIFTFRPCF